MRAGMSEERAARPRLASCGAGPGEPPGVGRDWLSVVGFARPARGAALMARGRG